MALNLWSEVTAESAILYCSGQLVAGPHTSQLRSQINELTRKCRTVIVDLGQIDYIDSSGLSVLVGMYSAAHATGAEIRYRNLSTSVNFRKSRAIAA